MQISLSTLPSKISQGKSSRHAALVSFSAAHRRCCSRFIFNIPEWERNSMERVGFQVESAHWYYEDFVREQNPSFPTCTLKKFFAMLWGAVPLLNEWHEMHEEAFDRFIAYKGFVPVCGAIILNEACDKVVLVKGWKNSAGWGFPKGKINQNEATIACARREVLEETGFDIKPLAIEENVISVSIYSQVITLYIVHPVSEDVVFTTRTRKEISRIEWFNLEDLPGWGRARVPGKFFLITPFMQELRSWVSQRKRQMQLQAAQARSPVMHSSPPSIPATPNAVNQQTKKKKGRDKSKANRRASAQLSGDFTPSGMSYAGSREFSSDDAGTASQETETSQMNSGDFNLVAILASGQYGNRGSLSGLSTTTTTTTPGSSPEAQRATPMAPPGLMRSHTDSSLVHAPSPNLSYQQQSAISSSAPTSTIQSKDELARRAQQLLDSFADDAVRQSPTTPYSSEQTPRPRPVSIPISAYPPMPNQIPHPFQTSTALSQDRMVRDIPLLSMPSIPSRSGSLNHPGPYMGQPPNGSFVQGMLSTNGVPPLHTNMPPNPHPIQSYPYRPSSVPIQDYSAHQTPTISSPHNALAYNVFNPSASSAINTTSDKSRLSPAASTPRNVPHAQQLLALFHGSPS
ncbi:related to decapping enzyme [Serendipita indica DSM 11827]|uniref:Related to decapping enzyme n=1 Tax=Serendipita indica (strain DSM 11827) TaxID=1109443 RepID=G4U2W2_SERID|nr:related to decapping enzyme [Serendipita indica DSM 11827]